MRSGEEIRAALVKFAARWRDYAGNERAEAHTFIDELFACYGTDRRDRGAVFEDPSSSGGILDVNLPGVVIVEMKAPREAARLARHRPQALEYWYESADLAARREAPPYVVLCAFQRFEIWEPGRYPREPVLSLSLDELPDQYDALMFLAGEEPLFRPATRRMTEQVAGALADIYRDLLARQPRSRTRVQQLMLGTVWRLIVDQAQTEFMLQNMAKGWARELISLWTHLDQTVDADLGWPDDGGEPMGPPTPAEAGRLLEIAGHDWPSIDPTIFGSLMEGFLGAQARAALGAHYTHEVDILRIVRPTIVRPWQQRIATVSSVPEGLALLGQLCAFRVLDPACGCGNFLYVAYRELNALAAELKQRTGELAGEGMPAVAGRAPYIPLRNMHGFDIEVVAAGLARTTLRIGQWQMDRSRLKDPTRRVPLPTIQAKDALAEPWPDVDCIVGNPPFLGSQQIRRRLGPDYERWLRKEFDIGIKDYCVYFLRRAHDHLRPGQRAGFVVTNSVAQNRARPVSLQYILDNGGVITDAVSSQHWPGSAAVDVSLVNWELFASPPSTGFVLDGVAVPGITADLRTPETSTVRARPLSANRGRCLQGMSPVGEGFILSAGEAAALLARTEANYRDVVRPYLIGEDIAESPRQAPGRWVIDFGRRPLEAAMAYPAALAVVRERVKPLRAGNPDRFRREHWWLFGRPYAAVRSALDGLPRYLAAGRVGKRLLFAWCEPWTCPSDLVYVFAFSDDYSMGVLSSSVHEVWARSRSSTLTDRLRYTPTSAFMPFAWPGPLDAGQAARVAAAGRQMLARRQEICLREGIGLTKLYNRLADGAYADLKKAQRELDAAVVACYGWPAAVARDPVQIVRRLLSLNREIVSGARPYHPFPSIGGAAGGQQLALDLVPESRAA